jgi:succinate dehydrogenase/fumarate reductase flavoprotein subunit
MSKVICATRHSDADRTAEHGMTASNRRKGIPEKWDETFDVIVMGYGYAGGVAAIEASEAGAKVLLVEKMPDPGGISICSGGNVRIALDAANALTYLKTTCAGTTPDDVLAVLADGMTKVQDYFEYLAKPVGATVNSRITGGNYPFPGGETFGYAFIENVPDFDPAARYPSVNSYVPIQRAAGVRLFKVLEDNVAMRNVTVRLQTSGEHLITDNDGVVCGLAIRTAEGDIRNVKARRAVILASGGFEADPEMQRQHWQGQPVLLAAFSGSTGDGIRMSQDAGAALWHMWNYHGCYGFKHPDPDYPFGIRVKRLPDWMPGKPPREDVLMPWILVDQDGHRYMSEYPPYMQDTSHRPMAYYDPLTQRYPRIPSFMVLDSTTKGTWPLGSPTFNDRRLKFDYSPDALRALEDSILTRAESIADLAAKMKVDERVLQETLDRWNGLCDTGEDRDFHRPSPSMMKIEVPPYYFAQVWPICSNTHGGPVHNRDQQVMDVYGAPIPRLYAAGELGGVFGHLYLGGGNLAECFVGGWVAGRHAAGLESWD